MNFTKGELVIIEDSDFLLTKVKVIAKVRELLVETRSEIYDSIQNSTFSFQHEINLKTGKISKGENYKNLPYLVLDYPSLFGSEDTFAFRTMFWWGNFFSATLHLQGNSLNKYRRFVVKRINRLVEQEVFISIGDEPWEYHYEKNNYIPLKKGHRDFIQDCHFLKLSKKTSLKNWENVPRFSSNFLELLLSVLH